MAACAQGKSAGPGVGAVLLAAILSCAPAAAAERLHKYTVAVAPALDSLNVRACFDGAPPENLVAESLDAALVLGEVRIEATGKAITPSGAISLKAVEENGCIRYSVDISRPIKVHDRSGGKVRKVGGDVLVSVGLWFWRPEKLEVGEDIEIGFRLPEGIAVSAPWRPAGFDRTLFRVGHAPHDWPASVAFGRFKERDIRVGDARLRLAVLDGNPAADAAQMQDWIADAAQSVAGLYGRFPLPQVQVIVVPGARGDEPTPWAYVVRGGSPAVHFFVNQRRAIQEYFDDWTATHELAHLLLPYVNPEDAWLSEGVATYYQNVLRARSGRITAADAWERLHAGFLRGIDSAPGLTLAQATENMYNGGTYMRVYWQGAAIAMIADLRLRQLTAGKQSLDTALAALNECCSSPERGWNARSLFDKLDEITGTTVFRELHEQHVAARDFPDLAPAYRLLGISLRGSEFELLPGGREQQMRDAIMDTGVLVVGEEPIL